MPFGLGFGELILIFAVLLLVFGAKRLPEIGGALGKGIRDFKRGINSLDESEPPAAPPPPPPSQQLPSSSNAGPEKPQS